MFDPTTLTGFHTWLSIVALVAGLVLIRDLLRGERSRWTALFLATAVLASVTGFLFPFAGFLPSHGVGVVSLVVLAAAVWGWSRSRGAFPGGLTRVAFVAATYLLAFVAVAQAFMKVPGLGGQGPGFAAAQAVLLAVFVGLGWFVARGPRTATA